MKPFTLFITGLILGLVVGVPVGNRPDLIPSWLYTFAFIVFILGLLISFNRTLNKWKKSLLVLSGLSLGLLLGLVFLSLLVMLMGGTQFLFSIKLVNPPVAPREEDLFIRVCMQIPFETDLNHLKVQETAYFAAFSTVFAPILVDF